MKKNKIKLTKYAKVPQQHQLRSSDRVTNKIFLIFTPTHKESEAKLTRGCLKHEIHSAVYKISACLPIE